MKIVSITHSKGKLYAIQLDDDRKLRLHADLLVSEHLSVGMELDEARIAALKTEAARHRTYEYALYLLERRSYSYRELYDKLMQAKHGEEDIVLETLTKLLRIGLLNDARYAESLARSYIEGKHYGLRRAALELRRRGISQNEIEDALAPYQESDTIAEQLAMLIERKYAAKLCDPDDRKARERVIAALMRRGFDYSDIRNAIEDYFARAEANATNHQEEESL